MDERAVISSSFSVLGVVDCGFVAAVHIHCGTCNARADDPRPTTHDRQERMNDTGTGGTGSYGIEYGKFRGPHCNVARQGTLAALPPTERDGQEREPLESASWIWGPISQAGWQPRDTIGDWRWRQLQTLDRRLDVLVTSKNAEMSGEPILTSEIRRPTEFSNLLLHGMPALSRFDSGHGLPGDDGSIVGERSVPFCLPPVVERFGVASCRETAESRRRSEEMRLGS
ncbi:uncharacterized protein B0H64DRAFT_67022 [Chaetomium fimeti]|uniref:Uncharacterized protein n=1 Tax=Chaetomium fimeti TaxID=1854472 RepID=A0AAE0HM34_9PEZI|nr:hypothetical protein B0H64DRAFT_67022 [Chaetomium fimeti]